MRYLVALEPGDARHAWGVTVPDLPGCFSAGDTMEEALDQAREAILLRCMWKACWTTDSPCLAPSPSSTPSGGRHHIYLRKAQLRAREVTHIPGQQRSVLILQPGRPQARWS
jgi:hypothetical protein